MAKRKAPVKVSHETEAFTIRSVANALRALPEHTKAAKGASTVKYREITSLTVETLAGQLEQAAASLET